MEVTVVPVEVVGVVVEAVVEDEAVLVPMWLPLGKLCLSL
jgi:hypothetical protein